MNALKDKLIEEEEKTKEKSGTFFETPTTYEPKEDDNDYYQDHYHYETQKYKWGEPKRD